MAGNPSECRDALRREGPTARDGSVVPARGPSASASGRAGSEEALLPRVGRLLVDDLEIEVVLERPRAARADVIDHLAEAVFEVHSRLVAEEVLRLVRGAVGQIDLLRAAARVVDLQREADE